MGSHPVNSPNMQLEVVVFNVSDVDRTKAFYENLGWQSEASAAADRYREQVFHILSQECRQNSFLSKVSGGESYETRTQLS